MAKAFNNGIDQAMYAATLPLETLKLLTVKLAARERERLDTNIAPDDNNSSFVIRVNVHRAYFWASGGQAKPHTHMRGRCQVKDQAEGGQVCGWLVKTMHGTRQAAPAWQEDMEKAMRAANMNPGALSPLRGRGQASFTVTTLVIVTRQGD